MSRIVIELNSRVVGVIIGAANEMRLTLLEFTDASVSSAVIMDPVGMLFSVDSTPFGSGIARVLIIRDGTLSVKNCSILSLIFE